MTEFHSEKIFVAVSQTERPLKAFRSVNDSIIIIIYHFFYDFTKKQIKPQESFREPGFGMRMGSAISLIAEDNWGYNKSWIKAIRTRALMNLKQWLTFEKSGLGTLLGFSVRRLELTSSSIV